MNALCALTLLCLLQLVTLGFSLQCWTCSPRAEINEDCGQVKDDQLLTCLGHQNLCRSTAVSMYVDAPGSKTVESLTINRGCSATADYPGQAVADLRPTGEHKCRITYDRVSQHDSKLCLCNYDHCNGRNRSNLADMSPPQQDPVIVPPPPALTGAASLVPAATVISAIASLILLTLRRSIY